jgi:hypothetical protein
MNINLSKFFSVEIIYVVLFLLYGIETSAQNFSKEEVISDLEYLRISLEEAHINLYAYTTKIDFQQNYEKVKQSIQKDSFSVLEANKIFQSVVSKANNGHTRIPFPVESYFSYAENGGTLFPLEIAFEDEKAFVRKNWSNADAIQVGSEIKSINGKQICEIIEDISPYISAERSYFKLAQIEGLSLPRFYWLTYGEQETFEVEIIKSGRPYVFKINAVKVIEGYEMKRHEILDNNRFFKFYDRTAYLHPGKFNGNLEKYKQFIDSAFFEISQQKSKNLIIDLRNHSGGDEPFGNYLVSYFADNPFKWNSNFEVKISPFLKENTRKTKDTTQKYWKKILSYDYGVKSFDHDPIQPKSKEKRFQGKVYVLVNRQSYSQSTVTASQIKDYGWATIVGEETGEFPNLYASIYSYMLPETGITVEVSKGKIQRVSDADHGKGLMPDIEIKDHLLDNKDEIMEGLLKRLN